MKHSPTPWKIIEGKDELYGRPELTVADADCNVVIDGTIYEADCVIDHDIIRRCVHAVNNHDALVAAMDAINDWMCECGPEGSDDPDICPIIQKSRYEQAKKKVGAALANAKEVPSA